QPGPYRNVGRQHRLRCTGSPAMTITRRSASIRKLQRALITTVLDGAGAGSAKICCVLMRGARADMFGCASHREIFQLLQKLPSWQPKKPDRYWCAPVRTPAVRKAPVISGKEVGYVRRSEFTFALHWAWR